MVLVSGQCDSVRKDVVLKKRKVYMKAKQNFMRMVLISGQCDSVRKDVVLKKRIV